MNGYQRIHAALEGKTAEGIPVSLHNFLLAAEEAGYTQGQYREDPKKIAESFIRAVETYRYDGILVDIDTVTLAGAVGVPVDFPEKECARTHSGNLENLDQVEELEPVDIIRYKYVNVWLEAVRLLADHFKGEISVRGNCDQAPFSLASMMRGAQNWMMDIYDEENEPLVTRLLEYCTGVTSQFIRHMADTGADIVSNGDSVAGPSMISPAMYEKFALPYEKKVAETAHEAGLPYIVHICGNTDPILDLVKTSGADGVELDYLTDTNKIYDAFRGEVTLFGTIDPSGVLARGTVDEVKKAVEDLLTVYGGEDRFVLNSGCAIPATAPSDNIHAMIQTARSYSKE